ncbi:GNAT family N-acetyltransferase [Paraflavitalea sp. CAU 1676]|uniref:GNAT family N-acetyltransferase n=1 Tax=Paraflavitalea sp. CAU 1676 TaxID=3032598 RepID=UPI0023DC57B6|nr:GNAT family N-acetyltransferase [Paraflavitalea sp. CAU 1676]MDF2189668.1 GNAT family N-acetyltransferase [Paraflavitalea sp. CAU 1676]
MQLRPATPEDRPAIIELLRQSLGESSIPKSEALWVWKHEHNPFGPSYVLVAEENGKLIGLRAFMQWSWIRNDRVYRTVRAVDTATHPDHQGKGIFKKLTLQQLESCRQEGILFVFNTPNGQSKPGYLKMGWVEQGKMPIKFKILRPFTVAKARFFDKEKYTGQSEDPSPFQKWTLGVLGSLDRYVQRTNQLATLFSPQYISWRYANNPLYSYNYFTDQENYLLISRIKMHAYTKELRLVDFIRLNPQADNGYLNATMKAQVSTFCEQYQIDFISLSGQQFQANKACFNWMGMLPVRRLGPTITLRDLNMKENFQYLLDTKNWCYSTGDLELF